MAKRRSRPLERIRRKVCCKPQYEDCCRPSSNTGGVSCRTQKPKQQWCSQPVPQITCCNQPLQQMTCCCISCQQTTNNCEFDMLASILQRLSTMEQDLSCLNEQIVRDSPSRCCY
jgi:hypothetical protein